ncbi:MAG TPA: DUF1844 domain-containing protein [Syntrophorhabdaceae bacterium]|nr:DUF1844 domain-containing protein [Syntrophorhabdaceae bacterium]
MEDKTNVTEESYEASDEASGDIFSTIDFSTFLLSLSTSALVSLGELPDPLRNEKSVNLALAKQTIHVIEMLQDKTKGNLIDEEERLIEGILYDLRMKYVRAAG